MVYPMSNEINLITRRRLARQLRRSVAKLEQLTADTGRLIFDQRWWVAEEVADDIDPMVVR